MCNIVIAKSKLKDEEDKEDEETFVLVGCKKCNIYISFIVLVHLI